MGIPNNMNNTQLEYHSPYDILSDSWPKDWYNTANPENPTVPLHTNWPRLSLNKF